MNHNLEILQVKRNGTPNIKCLIRKSNLYVVWSSGHPQTDNVDTILETKLLWLPRRSVNAVYVSHLPTLPTQSKISPHQNDVEHCENFFAAILHVANLHLLLVIQPPFPKQPKDDYTLDYFQIPICFTKNVVTCTSLHIIGWIMLN